MIMDIIAEHLVE